MAIIFKEKPESGAFGVDSQGAHLTLLFWARGSEDPTAIYEHIVLNTDPVKYGLIRTDIKAPTKQGGGLRQIEVEYGDPGRAGAGSGGTPVGTEAATPTAFPDGDTALDPVNDGMEFSFDCATGTQHITKSLAVVSAVGLNGATPEDCHGAIGATDDGAVKSCDILAITTDFTITTTKDVVTLNTLKGYAALGAKTNLVAWGPFLAGECLYAGFNAQGTQRGKWSLNHRFKFATTLTSVSVFGYDPWLPNTTYGVGDEVVNDSLKRYRCTEAGMSAASGGPTGTGTNITDNAAIWDYVGDGTGITIASVAGHDYIDVKFSPDPTTGRSVPTAVYVHRVYTKGDYSVLDLGV